MNSQKVNLHINHAWALLRARGTERYARILAKRKEELVQAYNSDQNFPEKLFFFVEVHLMHSFFHFYEKSKLGGDIATSEKIENILHHSKEISNSYESGDADALVESLEASIQLLYFESFFFHIKSEARLGNLEPSDAEKIVETFEISYESGDSQVFRRGVFRLINATLPRLLSPRSVDFQGNSLLHLAAFEEDQELYSFLINAGWNPRERNKYGYNAHQIFLKEYPVNGGVMGASDSGSEEQDDFTPDDFLAHGNGEFEQVRGTFLTINQINDPEATEWILDEVLDHTAAEIPLENINTPPVQSRRDLQIHLVSKFELAGFLAISEFELDNLLRDGVISQRHVFRIQSLERFNISSIIQEGFSWGGDYDNDL